MYLSTEHISGQTQKSIKASNNQEHQADKEKTTLQVLQEGLKLEQAQLKLEIPGRLFFLGAVWSRIPVSQVGFFCCTFEDYL